MSNVECYIGLTGVRGRATHGNGHGPKLGLRMDWGLNELLEYHFWVWWDYIRLMNAVIHRAYDVRCL
jgi:hypothetical protein